jgi:hypothetical protein
MAALYDEAKLEQIGWSMSIKLPWALHDMVYNSTVRQAQLRNIKV